jgi:hypothetical protein
MSEPDGYMPLEARDKTIWNIREIDYPETSTMSSKVLLFCRR